MTYVPGKPSVSRDDGALTERSPVSLGILLTVRLGRTISFEFEAFNWKTSSAEGGFVTTALDHSGTRIERSAATSSELRRDRLGRPPLPSTVAAAVAGEMHCGMQRRDWAVPSVGHHRNVLLEE